MTYRYELTGEVPAKKNSRVVTNTGRNFPNQQYKDWHDGATAQLMLQTLPLGGNPDKPSACRLPLEKCKSLTVTFFHRTRARRDTDNQASSVKDLLVDCGVLQDDNWTVIGEEHYIPVYAPKDEAHCVIEIESEA